MSVYQWPPLRKETDNNKWLNYSAYVIASNGLLCLMSVGRWDGGGSAAAVGKEGDSVRRRWRRLSEWVSK